MKPNGTTWDFDNSRPDIFVLISNLNIRTPTFSDVEKINLPLRYTLFSVDLIATNDIWTYQFFDEDLFDANDGMATLTANPLSHLSGQCLIENEIIFSYQGDGYDLQLIFELE